MSSEPVIWPAAQDRELAALRAQAERQAERQATERNLAHNLAARLDNLAGALAELKADLEADSKPRKHQAELLGYWAMISAELAQAARDLKEAGK